MQSPRTSRRAFLSSMTLLALAAKSKTLLPQPGSVPVEVHTGNGVLRGVVANGTRIFRGVPFAQPPVESLRYLPPAKALAWQSPRDATRFASAAMQPSNPGVPQSEDCLYLNVWAPSGKGPYPVFVWVHGGGFTGGTSFDPVADGTHFTSQGIICVTVAYRLGVFGFLDLEPLLGSSYAGSANNGLRDVIASLEWVHDNIADFGGDPARVTVGGESAGAKLSDILMGVPSAQHLFHQVISESGGAERVFSQTLSQAVAKGFADDWRKFSSGGESALRSAPAKDLIAAQQTFIARWPQHFPLRAEVDASLLPRLPIANIESGTTRGKRLLIGTMQDESALFVGPQPSRNATAADLGNISLNAFNEAYAHYRTIYPQLTDEQLRIRALTAEEYWIPTIRVADAHLKGGGQAWMYRMDFAETSGRLQGYAYHSLDVGLVWNVPHEKIANASQEAALANQVHLAWSAFIKGNSPAAPGLPTWPEYNTSLRPTMILNATSAVEQNPHQSELDLWSKFL